MTRGRTWRPPDSLAQALADYERALALAESAVRDLDPAGWPEACLEDALLFMVFHSRYLLRASMQGVQSLLMAPPFRLPRAAFLRGAGQVEALVMLRFYRPGVREREWALLSGGPIGRLAADWQRRGADAEQAVSEALTSPGGLPLEAALLAVSEACGGLPPSGRSLCSGLSPGAGPTLDRLAEGLLPRLCAYRTVQAIDGRAERLAAEDPSLGEVFDAALLEVERARAAQQAADQRAQAAEEAAAALRAELETLRHDRMERAPHDLPLYGRRVLVFGDPPHAADYTALLRAHGADPSFFDAFAAVDRLAHRGGCLPAADAVVVCAAYCPHRLWDVLPRQVPQFVVPQAGLGAFRRMLSERLVPALRPPARA